MEKADYKACFGSAKIDFLTVPKQLSTCVFEKFLPGSNWILHIHRTILKSGADLEILALKKQS